MLKYLEKVRPIDYHFLAISGQLNLTCFIFMILFIFILNVPTRKQANVLNKKFLYFMAYGLDAGLIGYLVAGFFVTVLYYPFFWVQLAMTVALYSVTSGIGQASSALSQRREDTERITNI